MNVPVAIVGNVHRLNQFNRQERIATIADTDDFGFPVDPANPGRPLLVGSVAPLARV